MEKRYQIKVKTPGLSFLIKGRMIRTPFTLENASENELLAIQTKCRTYSNIVVEATEIFPIMGTIQITTKKVVKSKK